MERDSTALLHEPNVPAILSWSLEDREVVRTWATIVSECLMARR